MREILLNPNDFDLFDTELQPSDYDFFLSHKDTFRTMWIDQGRQFWTYFLNTYRCYHVEFGLIKTFPARSAEYGAILEEAFSYMAANFIEGRPSDAKTYIMDIAVLARNKGHVHYLESSETKFSPKDPFYYKDTREVYRKIFGEPTETKSRLKVYCQFDILVMFAGAVVRCLRRWLEASNLDDLCKQYWVEHETMHSDLQVICAKPGSDKIDLDFDRYQKEMETQYMIHKTKTKEAADKASAEGPSPNISISPELIELLKGDNARKIEIIKMLNDPRYKHMSSAEVIAVVDAKAKECNEDLQTTGKEKKKKKKKKKGKTKDEGFSEVFTIPGVQQRLGVGKDSVTAEFRVSDPYDNYPVRFTQRIKDMGKYQKVQLLYEKDTPTGTIKKALYIDMEEFDEVDFHLYIAELLHNPEKMVDITEDETNLELPVVGKTIIQATQEEPVLEKEPAIFTKEAELRIAESLAKNMSLTQVANVLGDALGTSNDKTSPGVGRPLSPMSSVVELMANILEEGACPGEADLTAAVPKSTNRQQNMKADLQEKLRTQNLVADTEREKEKVTKMIELFWRTEERRKREGDPSPDCLANVMKDCDDRGLSADEKETIIMRKMRNFVSEKFSEERKQLAEDRKAKAKLEEKKPHPSGRDLAVEIPMLAKAFDYDLPPPPTMKKNKKGKLLKTRLREEEVVRTLLSADTSKYIEATTFKEPGAPHSKFFIDIPKDSCSEPKFRYCDPHKNRTIVGPVRHELLIGLMHKHTLYLCPRDGEVEKEFQRINPNWESKGVLMLTDTPENDIRINNSVLYNKPMPDFDLKFGSSTAQARCPKTDTQSPSKMTKAQRKIKHGGSSTAMSSATISSTKPYSASTLKQPCSHESIIETPSSSESNVKGMRDLQASTPDKHKMPQARDQHEIAKDVMQCGQTEQGKLSDKANNEEEPAGNESGSLRQCTHCHTTEPEPRKYKKCQRCKHETVIEARYYCSKECQVDDWKLKHRKEHRDQVLETYNATTD